ncbi:Glycosyltransferase-like protein [Zostera marina]|uniref:Glycosyltransferase-like protein n=1 Tax=Zostera marina TaxID=29655 RepID=A0A0K9NR32_ZOSMR|nr:Glycosyltransferase-like protein [Zostera marina]
MTFSFSEISGRKPLFMAVYTVVFAGIIFSALFVLSSFRAVTPPSFDEVSKFPRSRSKLPAMDRPNSPTPLSNPTNRLEKQIWDAPAFGSKMPPSETFRLTKNLVEQRVKDNVIIVTFGNYAFMDFILTWVKHLTDLNVTNLLVGAMDDKLMEELYWKGIPVFDMGSHMKTHDVGWGSREFHKMGREKVFLINSILPFGYELLMCDTDMVWLKNPLPYFARFPEADVLTSSDHLVPTVSDDRLELWKEAGSAYNIGIFHWRPTNASLELAKKWRDLLITDDSIWDQNAFNDLLRAKQGPSFGNDGLFYAFNGYFKLGILPTSIFCSGHTYFVQRVAEQLNLKPYAVHTTFQYAGTPGKRHRLREGMLFYDPPEYYNSTGGFLSFKPSIPKSMLFNGKHDITNHFLLVNYQIKQVRTALAVALLLNRTLVMPPIWCRLDRLWYPHPGILPGTLTKQPFICPMDHVFEVNHMLDELPEAEFGQMIDFREYSFLENPLLPKKVKESWISVELCEETSASCNSNKADAINFPKNSSEEKFIQVFSLYKDIKVIQFSSMENVFQGFTDKDKETKFRKRVKRYTGIWCCVENHIPGHIYYDIYWDEKAGWKPNPPEKREDDHTPL